MDENKIKTIVDEAIAKNCTVFMSCTDGNIASVHISPPDDSAETEFRIRNTAADICNIFEDLLEEFGLTIPSKLREGEEDEARLFGDEYVKVEDAVTNRLVNLVSVIKSNPDVIINTTEY